MKRLRLFLLSAGTVLVISVNLGFNHSASFKDFDLKSITRMAIECPPGEFSVEFCDEGTLGVCCDKVSEVGFSCVNTCGDPDCDGTHWQCI